MLTAGVTAGCYLWAPAGKAVVKMPRTALRDSAEALPVCDMNPPSGLVVLLMRRVRCSSAAQLGYAGKCACLDACASEKRAKIERGGSLARQSTSESPFQIPFSEKRIDRVPRAVNSPINFSQKKPPYIRCKKYYLRSAILNSFTTDASLLAQLWPPNLNQN